MNDNEKTFLSILINDANIIYKCKLLKQHFLSEKNQRLFSAIKQTIADGVEPDVIILHRNSGIAISEISELASSYVSSANWLYYHNAILENYRLGEIKKLQTVIPDFLARSNDSSEIIAQIDNELQRILTDNEMHEIERLGDNAKIFLEAVEKRYKINGQLGALPGIETGFYGLDQAILGLRKKTLTYIAARPSQGKSALAINMINHISKKHKVGLIDLESDKHEKMQRLVALNGNINSMNLAKGQLSKNDLSKLLDATRPIYERDVFTYDKPGLRLSELKLIARRMVQFYKVEIIFIDYWQLIRHDDRKIARHEQLEDISQQLKDLSRVLDIPIVCLAQLNRENEKHGAIKPADDGNYYPHWAKPSELKGSGSAEQDADVLIFIEHGYDDKKTLRNSFLHIAKARDGIKKIIEVQFIPQFLKFKELDNNTAF